VLARKLGVPVSRISEARTVLAHAPELAAAVVKWTMPLTTAYMTGRQRKTA